jgi:type II secretory pathway pseudopilin PulG
LELLIVVALIAILTGVGMMHYRTLMQEGNEERIRVDLRTLKKAIIKLESDQRVTIRPGGPNGGPHPYMEPGDLGVNLPYVSADEPGGFDFERLLDFRLITRLPSDPYGFSYQIDIPGGFLFSMGPDGMPDTGDETYLPFKPAFEATRATITEDQLGVQIEFNRKVDPYSLFTTDKDYLPFEISIDGAAASQTPLTTAARIMTNPFSILVRLNTPVNVSTPNDYITLIPNIDVGPRNVEVRAMDTATLINLNAPLLIRPY